jgi:hypothetical protein
VVVRSSLAPFDCTAVDGIRVMDAEPSIVCGSSDGPHWRMSIVGGITLVVFALGVPLWFGLFLLINRERVQADQYMRVRGEGDSLLTNPHIQLRNRCVANEVEGLRASASFAAGAAMVTECRCCACLATTFPLVCRCDCVAQV